MSAISNPGILKIREFLSNLDEKQFRQLLKNFFEIRCGPTILYHSISEHGLDIASVYEGKWDFIYRDSTVLVQAKVGKVSPKELRENIFGQMSELFVRTIEGKPFHPENPRRLLLVIAGEVTKEGRDLISNWNKKMPIPIELIELDEISKLVFDVYATLENVKRATKGKPQIIKKSKASKMEMIMVMGKEDAIESIDMSFPTA